MSSAPFILLFNSIYCRSVNVFLTNTSTHSNKKIASWNAWKLCCTWSTAYFYIHSYVVVFLSLSAFFTKRTCRFSHWKLYCTWKLPSQWGFDYSKYIYILYIKYKYHYTTKWLYRYCTQLHQIIDLTTSTSLCVCLFVFLLLSLDFPEKNSVFVNLHLNQCFLFAILFFFWIFFCCCIKQFLFLICLQCVFERLFVCFLVRVMVCCVSVYGKVQIVMRFLSFTFRLVIQSNYNWA